MKSLIYRTALLLATLILLITPSCKQEQDNPFDEQAKQDYEAMIALQEEADSLLADFQATMDSVSAVTALAQWYRDQEPVESVVVSSQGLSIRYTSGIWGGILIDPKRYDESPSAGLKSSLNLNDHIKNLPTKKTAIFMPACDNEFVNSNDRQYHAWKTSFNNLGYDFACPGGANVHLNALADLRSLGSVLCLDSHGYAWPADDQISEVYFKTGELANLKSTEKYYKDILDKNIIILENIGDPSSATYYISPGFITRYNDFSKDTILFFGGFCYSDLGSWPSLADACASGTYFGFDWIVRSDKCADWAIDLVNHLADQEAAIPWTTESWMSSSPIAKQYFDEDLNRTVRISYTGNGALTLWKPENQGNGTIISVSDDGAPVTVPGFTCTDYILKCLPEGQLPQNVSYDWDFGDGETYYTVNDNLSISHHWALPQAYSVKVTVSDISGGNVIMELSTTVSFIYPDFLPELKTNTILDVFFGPYQSIIFSGNVTGFPGFDFNTEFYDLPLTWADSSFTSQDSQNNDYETITIEGNVSSEGSILRHCLLKKISQDQPDHELTLEITELPVLSMDPVNCINSFRVSSSGSANQSWLTRVEYKEYDPVSQTWIIITSLDWSTTELLVEFKKQ